jgi:hypothetical protein
MSWTPGPLADAFDELLATHIVGYSWNCWNEERLLAGLPPLELPVEPVPLPPLLATAKHLGILGRTRLTTGSVLYRGFGTVERRRIRGVDEVNGTLTLDRITSFSPFQDQTIDEHGPVICAVILTSPDMVFSDDSECVDCRYGQACRVWPGKVHHSGDLAMEVQLLPGTYVLAGGPAWPSSR